MAVKSSTWELMVEGEELSFAANARRKAVYERTINLQPGIILDETALSAEGWSVTKKTKKKVSLEKVKPYFDMFEDEVWMLFYKMGFTSLNKDNSFAVVYSGKDGKQLSKQIDVIAVDEDVCILIECKCTEVEGTVPDFRTDINEIAGIRAGVFKEIESKYPGRKMVYIFATKGYALGLQDKNRLRNNNIFHFDDTTMLYYQSLTSELGKATKYQLLGSLFAGEEIANLDCYIPAIRGKMQNGLKYYTFIIQPAKLLKIGYVLHRTNANNDYEDLLPSYQRIIKKDRLRSVRDFVEGGGYFPNSLIISIDSDGPLKFNVIDSKDDMYSMGYLQLPNKFQSSYIIDGQHRLYGYSESDKANTETVPVVAFENLDKSEQLRLFMDINENQKSVPKALRNILSIDINYESENPKDRQDALLGKIAKRLGEDINSPLYQRVVIGEDASTDRCCVTMDYIKDGLKATGLFCEYKRNKKIKPGIFDKESNDEIFSAVYPVVIGYLQILKTALEQEWQETGSWLIKNTMIYAMFAVLGDIIRISASKKDEPFKNALDLLSSVNELSNDFALVIGNLEPTKRKKVKDSLGGSAKATVYRLLQMTFYEEFSEEFVDEEIEKYYTTCYQDYKEIAEKEVSMISKKLILDAKTLIDGPDWMKSHLSLEKANSIVQKRVTEQLKYEYNNDDTVVSEWDVMTLSDVVSIYGEGTNWSDTFKTYFSGLGYKNSKMEMLATLKSVVECETHIKNGAQIKKSEYDVVHPLYSALFEALE